MKRLIVFADGTWGSPKSRIATNVLRLARSCASRGDKPKQDDERNAGNVEQVIFYDWGIGTESTLGSEALSGEGIDKNIQDCYRFLVHNYSQGDELFFFGFSRGAYTVRSLAGLIRNCGLLLKAHAERIPQAYALYRRRGAGSTPWSKRAAEFRAGYCHADRTQIHFIGVWDTVGALGIPVPFWGSLGKRHFLFHDTALSSNVSHARQALALDERRGDFEPCLWREHCEVDLKQVWFAGTHSDVGGGSGSGFADTSLTWLAAEAQTCGLVLAQDTPLGYLMSDAKEGKYSQPSKLLNSARGLFAVRPKQSRRVRGAIHRSAMVRYEQNIDDYQARAQALNTLLDSVDGDWNRLEIEEQAR